MSECSGDYRVTEEYGALPEQQGAQAMTDLTASVTRWKHDALGHMTTEPDGEYMAYADHVRDMARLLEEVERLKAKLEAAWHALESYAHGNSDPTLARGVAEKVRAALRGQLIAKDGLAENYRLQLEASNIDLARVRGLMEGLQHYSDDYKYLLGKWREWGYTEEADALVALLEYRTPQPKLDARRKGATGE